MKIIILCSIFPPEPFVAAQTGFSMAKGFSSLGHQVTVVTAFPNHPGGKFYPGYRNQLLSREESEFGFEIVRCLTAISSKSTFLSRFWENIVFGMSAATYILFMPRADVIYSDTWPIFASGLMTIVAKIRRIPYIIHIVDLYPESVVSQGRLGNDQWTIKLMHKIDTWIARGAMHVIVYTRSFAQVYQEDRKIPHERISIIPNWVEGELDVVGKNHTNEVRQKFNIGNEDFIAAYGGNIGVGAGVDTLIRASTLVDSIHVLIAGGGSELKACQELANRIASDKISFYFPWPAEETMAFYQTADVLVLPTHGMQSVASIPSKLIWYMLSARPIIAAGLPETELFYIIEESGCGWVIPPDDPEELAQTILEAKGIGKNERELRGQAGREYALVHLTAEANLPKVIRIIEGISG